LKEKHKEETELLNEEITLSVTVDSPLINEYPEVYEMSIENNDIKTVECVYKDWFRGFAE